MKAALKSLSAQIVRHTLWEEFDIKKLLLLGLVLPAMRLLMGSLPHCSGTLIPYQSLHAPQATGPP